MKLFKKNENKETVKLPMSGKVKKGLSFRISRKEKSHFPK